MSLLDVFPTFLAMKKEIKQKDPQAWEFFEDRLNSCEWQLIQIRKEMEKFLEKNP